MKNLFRILTVVTAILLCTASVASAAAYEPVDLTKQQAAAANLFLSNFTEVGMEHCEANYDDKNMVDFAHDHMWFNDYEAYEYGEYPKGNNCRVSDDRIQEIQDGKFEELIQNLMEKPLAEIKELYNTRVIEK